MSAYFIFVDGIGIGKENQHNPFWSREWNGLQLMSSGNKWVEGSFEIDEERNVFKKIDANLDVEGLPQSGTGQTALFTGKNGAKEVGRHFGPYPHSKCKPLLKEKSIFLEVKKLDKNACFANGYPDQFFQAADKRNRWTCTTYMCKMAEIPLFTTLDVIDGRAITAEIKQDYWKLKLNIDLGQIDESQAAERFIKLGKDNDLVLFEYYLTDKAGHSMDKQFAYDALTRIDLFVKAMISKMGQDDLLLITSDHGNLEDLSTKSHTTNPVPLAVIGDKADLFSKAESILDIKPALLKWLEKKEQKQI